VRRRVIERGKVSKSAVVEDIRACYHLSCTSFSVTVAQSNVSIYDGAMATAAAAAAGLDAVTQQQQQHQQRRRQHHPFTLYRTGVGGHSRGEIAERQTCNIEQ